MSTFSNRNAGVSRRRQVNPSRWVKLGLAWASVGLMASCGGGSSDNPAASAPTPAPAPAPMITAVGVPFGVSATATVDAAGGSVVSADGRLTLTIPPGALTTATTIGIQPVTNEVQSGVGLGYSLTPDGQTFSAPVTLTLTYSDADLLGTTADFLRLAYQDAADGWRALGDPVVDKVHQSILVQTTHFTVYSPWAYLGIQPTSATVGLGKSIDLQVQVCDTLEDPAHPEARQLLNCTPTGSSFGDLSNWSVNSGAKPGSGTVVATVDDNSQARYTAPSSAPPPNPQAVSVKHFNSQLPSVKDLLVANVWVLDCPLANQPEHQCPVQYVGNTKGNYFDAGGLVTYDATANLTLAESQIVAGRFVNYVPSGLVHVSNVKSGDCTLAITPSTFDVSGGSVVIDFGGSPPQWSGAVTAGTTVAFTATCPDGSTATGSQQFGVTAFGDNTGGDLAADGSGFTGTALPAGGTVVYSFINAFRGPKAPKRAN